MQQLFRGGTLFDGEQAPLSGHALLVDGERIVDCAPAATFAGFTGRVIDTTRMTLLPGLIDCHVHLCFGAEAQVVSILGQQKPTEFALRALEHAQKTLRGGVTSVRDLGGCDYAEIAVRNAISKGRHMGPTILCAGKMICITGGHGWFVGIEADGVDAVIRAVRTNIKAGADCIKFMATGGVMTENVDPLMAHFTPPEVKALVEEARRFGRNTACHATGAMGVAHAVHAGTTSIEHGFELTDAVIAQMLERGTYLVPTLSAMGVVCKHGTAALPAYVGERVGNYKEMQRQSVLRYYRAGGRIAMGTDAGTPFNEHGSNAQELGYMRELGMSAVDVLRAATSSAADLLGLADRGRLKRGWRADLLLVEGAPHEDIRAVSDVANHRLVMKDGALIPSGHRPPSGS